MSEQNHYIYKFGPTTSMPRSAYCSVGSQAARLASTLPDDRAPSVSKLILCFIPFPMDTR